MIFGGTLKGICDALPALRLRVTVLYLNPIFEAQSNYRYDTGDYLKVDPILGQNASIEELFEEASSRNTRHSRYRDEPYRRGQSLFYRFDATMRPSVSRVVVLLILHTSRGTGFCRLK